MTDQELQELKDRLASLSQEKEEASMRLESISQDFHETEKLIRQEKRSRETLKEMDSMKTHIKNFFEKHQQDRTIEQLWMVKINGKLFHSNKGRYTWTSERLALTSIADYVCYYDYQIGKHSDELFIIDVVKELVKEGYIELIKVY